MTKAPEKCVLDGYTECAAKTPLACPLACICYQLQQMPSEKHRSMYEERYAAKYGDGA